MNTSKSLDSILRKLLGHDDPVEIGNGYHDDCAEEIAEAKEAIVEAVEGLIPRGVHISKEYLSQCDYYHQEKLNEFKVELRQTIKEWQ